MVLEASGNFQHYLGYLQRPPKPFWRFSVPFRGLWQFQVEFQQFLYLPKLPLTILKGLGYLQRLLAVFRKIFSSSYSALAILKSVGNFQVNPVKSVNCLEANLNCINSINCKIMIRTTYYVNTKIWQPCPINRCLCTSFWLCLFVI